jgi:hypothetical protein
VRWCACACRCRYDADFSAAAKRALAQPQGSSSNSSSGSSGSSSGSSGRGEGEGRAEPHVNTMLDLAQQDPAALQVPFGEYMRRKWAGVFTAARGAQSNEEIYINGGPSEKPGV